MRDYDSTVYCEDQLSKLQDQCDFAWGISNTDNLILGRSTATLDPISEVEIYSELNDNADDKAAIYIGHRLSSCKFCDEIDVFHEGAVIQQGIHAELIAVENGKYHELWNAQAQYYTEK